MIRVGLLGEGGSKLEVRGGGTLGLGNVLRASHFHLTKLGCVYVGKVHIIIFYKTRMVCLSLYCSHSHSFITVLFPW